MLIMRSYKSYALTLTHLLITLLSFLSSPAFDNSSKIIQFYCLYVQCHNILQIVQGFVLCKYIFQPMKFFSSLDLSITNECFPYLLLLIATFSRFSWLNLLLIIFTCLHFNSAIFYDPHYNLCSLLSNLFVSNLFKINLYTSKKDPSR